MKLYNKPTGQGVWSRSKKSLMSNKNSFSLSFYEIEHDGDLQPVFSDIENCGAKVIGSAIDYEEETASIQIETKNKETFFKKFNNTESAEFLN